MKIKFNDWNKFQGNSRAERRDQWFKIETDFLSSPLTAGLDSDEILCLIYFLCEATRADKGGEFTLNEVHMEKILCKKAAKRYSTLKYLSDFELIQPLGAICTDTNTVSCAQKEREKERKKDREKENASEAEIATVAKVAPVVAEGLSGRIREAGRELLGKVPVELQNAWIARFEDLDFIASEIEKAALWCEANPQRKPRSNYKRFMTSWLERAHDGYRKKFQPVKQKKLVPRHNPFTNQIDMVEVDA